LYNKIEFTVEALSIVIEEYEIFGEKIEERIKKLDRRGL
jgi:hypothetical protein